MLTDEDDLPAWRASYEAFGRAHVSSDPDGSVPTPDPGIDFNIRFPGQYYDAESGLHYNRFRTYDPAVGRYVSAGPIGQAAGINLYRYARNQPTSFLDFLGLSELVVDKSQGTMHVYPGDGQGGRAQGPQRSSRLQTT